MSDKVFIKILVSIVAAGVFITAFHAACRKDNANTNVSKLVDWLLSAEGQKLIEECGYVAINPIN